MIGGWFKRKLQIVCVRSGTEDLERFLNSLRGASGEELGFLLVVATTVRVNLRDMGRLPDCYMQVSTPRDGSAHAAMYLSRLIKEFQKNGQPMSAAGAMVWLHTLRALGWPELRVLGRQMWGELQRGYPYLEQAFLDREALTNTPVSAEVRAEARFLPPDLAPFGDDADGVRMAAGVPA